MARTQVPPNATQHGADSAAQAQGSSEDEAIAKCRAIGDQAMRDPGCAALAKKHPTMMNPPL